MSSDQGAAAGARISQWLARSAGAEQPAVFASIWASRILVTVETFLLPLAFWFKPFCVCLALVWLVYRATRVLYHPLDELASLLGFDIPATPLIDLASVKANGAVVHWSIPGKPKHKSQLKVEVYLNGIIIERLSWHESAVTISGLQPASYYLVRVALIHNEFSSKSAAVRFRTKPASSGDFYSIAPDVSDLDHDSIPEPLPRVRPYRGLADFTPPLPLASSMAREPSSGFGQMRTGSHRPSPTTPVIDHIHEPQPDDFDLRGDGEMQQELLNKLESIRHETEEAERIAREEDDDDLRQKEELLRERDDLKAEVNDKDKSSRNLKREVNTLERQNTAAQNERAKQERILQQKKQERQRLRDDMIRWDAEALELNAEVERVREERAEYLENAAHEKLALRDKHAEEGAKVRLLDDEVREKTAEIKKLDRVMKDSSPNGPEAEPNLVQQLQSEAEEERKWQALRHALQQQYSFLFKQLESAKKYYTDQMRYLDTLRAERRRHDEMAQYAASAALDRRPQRADSQRSRNAQNRHSFSESPRLSTFPLNHSPFANTVIPAQPSYNPSPFFNIQNGMSYPAPTDEVSLSDEDRERLTGGAAMSPNAAAGLIPTDLFAGESDNRRELVQPLPGLGSLPGLAGVPGASLQHQTSLEYPSGGPASPTASSSRSPSVFASPLASQHNLHSIGSPDNFIEADRRSIRSTRSSRAPSGGTSSRFSGMFGIKPRSKNVSDDGPPLSKASSMPRQDHGMMGLDSASRKRTGSIGGGVLALQEGGVDGASDAPAAASSRRAFGFFSKDKAGGWPSTFTAFSRRPASPRPVSTHSNELPRPSVDTGRWGADTWSLTDASAGARGSPLAFGTGWNAPSQQSRIFGSRHPSRRPSVQYGASGPPEDIMEDDDASDSDALDYDQAPNLAPIGTKPSRKSDPGAKLNPNAKDFKSFFSSMKFGSKDKTKESGESSDRNDFASLQASANHTPVMGSGIDNEDSPPHSRKSRDTRDTRSMTTEESSLIESGRNSTDLVRTPSYTNSDVPAPSPSIQSRGSFMQKLSRKSSSSKFLPSFKRDRSRLDAPVLGSSPGALPPTEDEEDGMSESVGSLKEVGSSLRAVERDGRDSKEGNRSARSWSSAFKLGKKKGTETHSMSDVVSMTSGTEDGEDEEDA